MLHSVQRMWGLSLIDLRRRTLVLSRDRLGVKPLYTWAGSQAFAFASEIKQFSLYRTSLPWQIWMRDRVSDTGYEVPPATFFKESRPSARVLGRNRIDQPTTRRRSLSGFQIAHDLKDQPRGARERTRDLFADSVKLRLRSDVPVGVCLSVAWTPRRYSVKRNS